MCVQVVFEVVIDIVVALAFVFVVLAAACGYVVLAAVFGHVVLTAAFRHVAPNDWLAIGECSSAATAIFGSVALVGTDGGGLRGSPQRVL